MRFQDIQFKLVRYANDFVYAFDISIRYHGWTRDKISNFHVFDENTGAYTTYETIPAFEAWLSSNNQGNTQTQQTNNNLQIQWTGLPEKTYNGFNYTPFIILGSLGVIYFLYTR